MTKLISVYFPQLHRPYYFSRQFLWFFISVEQLFWEALLYDCFKQIIDCYGDIVIVIIRKWISSSHSFLVFFALIVPLLVDLVHPRLPHARLPQTESILIAHLRLDCRGARNSANTRTVFVFCIPKLQTSDNSYIVKHEMKIWSS